MSERLLDLDEIESRANAAAPGPWKLRVHLEDGMSWLIGPRDCDAEFYDSDAYFIVHARQDVPALVVENRRLRAALESRNGSLTDGKIEEEAEHYGLHADAGFVEGAKFARAWLTPSIHPEDIL